MEKRSFGLYVCILLAAVAVSGCAHLYRVSIDSISNRQSTGKKYVIAAGNQGTVSNDLEFEEYSMLLANAMAVQGFQQIDAANLSDADTEVFLSYGIGAPETHVYSYTEPIWGPVGAQTITYATTTNQGNTQSTVAESDTEPTYGVTGYQEKTGTYVTYQKYIILDAFDLKKHNADNKLVHLWKTSISSVGQSKNLRHLFPIMLAAGAPYIGTDTTERVNVELTEDNDAVRKIEGVK